MHLAGVLFIIGSYPKKPLPAESVGPLIRFLSPSEYSLTKPLAAECFAQTADLEAYYAADVQDSRIAVMEQDGDLLSMAQLRRFFLCRGDEAVPAWYVLYVCTAEQHRRHGCMDAVLHFVLDTLRREGECFAFLVPVDPAIYAHLGFVHRWEFRPEERELLCADDGLNECFGCVLNGSDFAPPDALRPADGVSSLTYRDFDADAAAAQFDFFHVRPNRSYDSVPLDCFIWNDAVQSEYAVADGRCLLMKGVSEGRITGALPLCPETELPYYFRLQERYFNEILHQPFRAFLQDAEGIAVLRAAGMLDNYDVTEDPEIYDYLYDGEALRTLAGRGLAGKRNRIHKFEREYGSNWEYRTLGHEDRQEIISFLKRWDAAKGAEVGSGISMAESFDVAETLEIEVSGAIRLLCSPALMARVRCGGIYVDGRLCAFALGAWNPRERMAVIEIEKADPEMDGLYQLINREFLLHAFPEAEIVNREDDVGIPGLRQAKLSYHPIGFEKRYTLLQKDF